MNMLASIIGLCTLAIAIPSGAQTSRDSSAIVRAALDYAEGWYAGDGAQMEKALHPELAKRTVRTDQQGRSRLDQMSALTLVQATRMGYGKQTPENRRRKDVSILFLQGNMASVKVEMEGWIDMMHIARYNGEWKIVNVLWEMKPRQE